MIFYFQLLLKLILRSTNSTSQRLEYIDQIDEMLKKYKEQSPDIKWSKEEKDAVRKAYSHGSDLV